MFPGETLTIKAWDEPQGIAVSVTVGDDDRPALADCFVTRS